MTVSNKNAQNTMEQMNNTFTMLLEKSLIYYYNPAKCCVDKNDTLITWGGHKPSRENCGKEFIKLKQYEYILQSRAYHCILFDGSIIRSSFKFSGPLLVSHSHLWWPSPFDENLDDNELLYQYNDFLNDNDWMNKIKMRSPVRIDYDSSVNRANHPAVHMHTQSSETRLYLDQPICFNRFINEASGMIVGK